MTHLFSTKTTFRRPGGRVRYKDQTHVQKQINAADRIVDCALMGQNCRVAQNHSLREAYEQRVTHGLLSRCRDRNVPADIPGLRCQAGLVLTHLRDRVRLSARSPLAAPRSKSALGMLAAGSADRTGRSTGLTHRPAPQDGSGRPSASVTLADGPCYRSHMLSLVTYISDTSTALPDGTRLRSPSPLPGPGSRSQHSLTPGHLGQDQSPSPEICSGWGVTTSTPRASKNPH